MTILMTISMVVFCASFATQVLLDKSYALLSNIAYAIYLIAGGLHYHKDDVLLISAGIVIGAIYIMIALWLERRSEPVAGDFVQIRPGQTIKGAAR